MGDDALDPFARLDNTHRRIEQRLVDLERAAEGVSDTRERFQALDAVFDVLGFFGRAAARHHEDEEQSLFPRLAAFPEVAGVIRALHEEHVTKAAAHEELTALVRSFPDEGPEPADEKKLIALAKAFAASYRAHIVREEAELFPVAKRVLPQETQTAMEAEMVARRPNRGQHRG